MGAAAFVLAINLFIAGVFATAFGVIAVYARSAVSARWLAAAYGVGMADAALEFMLPFQTDPRPVGVGIFAAFLFAPSLCVIGLARHYRQRPPWLILGVVVLVSLAINTQIIGMPRTSMLRAALYQLPYFLVQMIGVMVILRAPRRRSLDQALLVLFLLSGLQFISKPLIAAAIGSGATPQAYLGSTYAAISQSVGAMLLIGNGLLMLLIIVRDAMAEITARSETDKLSGLLNRRGFEDKVDRLIANAQRTGQPGALILADLDHFKTINDSLGHEAGDRVIAAFAQVLDAAGRDAVATGRLGGEEFAAYLPEMTVEGAEAYAEGVRRRFAELPIASLGPGRRASASFGVAPLGADDQLSDLLRRADAALYRAKREGRDCVRVAHEAPLPEPSATADRRRGSRRIEAAE